MIVRPAHAATKLRRAFTLLEVLVVMAIILIIAGGATFAAMGYLARAKVNGAYTQMAKIQQAVKAYAIQNDGNYPENLNVLVNDPSGKPLLEGNTLAITDPWGKPYQLTVQTDSTGSVVPRIMTTDDSGKQIFWPKQ